MHYHFNNVNDAFRELVNGIHTKTIPTIRTSSRNGSVLQVVEPVTVTYAYPTQRVLFNKLRDANPFFHLFESLWMLAGRNDVAHLAYYVLSVVQFSDDGVSFNGAYGHRWRHAMVAVEYNQTTGKINVDHKVSRFANYVSANGIVDQIKILLEHLKKKPDSRRAVLQMWNVEDDLLNIDSSMDVCCNTNVYFALREEAGKKANWTLDMTVCNRSNDMIWGLLGANVVHFSMLQEYMACCLGVGVGMYHQITNNLHVYESNWKPELWLSDAGQSYDGLVPTIPLLSNMNREIFDYEIGTLVTNNGSGEFTEPFLMHVAQPMCFAFQAHKRRNYAEAYNALEHVAAEDWRMAGMTWIRKREENYVRKVKEEA